ncbi:hypothetical protein [Adhaeribacter pallidiroseus]|uniref:Uncharacterized protein n=1 Tax=Adhaeribacter pallidiroseus TaxID=2072847 RepID=A0A369QIM5_9BACT|nr:hypothetical protein [Adhaeribacter pallidiroseus]RDC64150.1 hypothetical protein AHMF7616_02761 [Adhaeribacter pallidiroseus]
MRNIKNFPEETVENSGSIILNSISWLFGIVVFAIGVVNMFYGNDPGFGIFILLLSFVYFLPVKAIFQKKIHFAIPRLNLLKVFLGLFIIWTALGVGELFDKINLLLRDLHS